MSTPGVIASADVALYAAKDAGGDCVVLGGQPDWPNQARSGAAVTSGR